MNNPPIEQEPDLPQLTLEVLVKVESDDPDSPAEFERLGPYPLQIDEARLASGQGIDLREAVTDIAGQMQDSGGIHAPATGNTMDFYPWHTVRWLRVRLEPRRVEREPPPQVKTRMVKIGE
jgi:hypothetical protein